MKWFKKKTPEKQQETTIQSDSEFAYLKPTEPPVFDLSELHNNCEDFLRKANPSDDGGAVRDAHIEALLFAHIKELEQHKNEAVQQWLTIQRGATAQYAFIQEESELLDTIVQLLGVNATEGGDQNDTQN